MKSLARCFCEGGVFSPLLLITGEGPKAHDILESGLIKPLYLDVRDPFDERHRIRALLSFLSWLPLRCWKSRRMINGCDIGVINPHFPGLNSLIFLMLKKLHLFKGKIILSFHGSDIRSALSSRGSEKNLWRILLRGADHIVVVSDDLAKGVLAMESTVAEKLTTIHNGVDLSMFAPEDEPRPRLSDPNDGKTLVSIGAFIPSKGHDVLVRAFSRVVRNFPDARLLLVGKDGAEIENIRQLVKSPPLTNNVKIIRNVPHEEIPVYLSQAALFVSASRAEGFPLAVIEAAATGLPVVCTRAAGLRELINDGVTGRLVDVDDEHALAEAIIDLLAHPEEAQRMAANLYEFVTNNLTSQHAYRHYLDLVGLTPTP